MQAGSAYRTDVGAMYEVDSSQAMAALPDETVDVVVTSSPYALQFKKEYGTADKAEYVDWFRPFGMQVLALDESSALGDSKL